MVLQIVFSKALYVGHLPSCIRFSSHMSDQLLILVVWCGILVIWEICACWNLFRGSGLRKWMDMLTCHTQRLSRLDLFSVKGRLLRADLIQVWKIMSGLSPHLSDLFLRANQGRTRGHSQKIFMPHHSTDVRGRFFSLRVISTWNSLPEAVVLAQSIQSFKHSLEQFLGHHLHEYC